MPGDAPGREFLPRESGWAMSYLGRRSLCWVHAGRADLVRRHHARVPTASAAGGNSYRAYEWRQSGVLGGVTCRCASESKSARDDCVLVSLSCSEHATSPERHKYRTENFVAVLYKRHTGGPAPTPPPRTNGNARAGAPGDWHFGSRFSRGMACTAQRRSRAAAPRNEKALRPRAAERLLS